MMIKTVDGFIDAIGGTASAALAFGVSRPAVSNWRAGGKLPAWAWMRARDIAHANDMTLEPRLFTSTRSKPGTKSKKRKAHSLSSAAE